MSLTGKGCWRILYRKAQPRGLFKDDQTGQIGGGEMVAEETLARLLNAVRAFVHRLDIVDARRDDIVSDVALLIVERGDLVERLDVEAIVP